MDIYTNNKMLTSEKDNEITAKKFEYPPFLKNKSVLFGLGTVVLIILIAVFSGGKTPRTSVDSSQPLPSPSRLVLSDLNEEKRARAQAYRQQIADRLPISIDNFETSVKIETNIRIFIDEGDPSEATRLEITGLSYLNPESDPAKNPNVKAFEESYRKAMQELRAKSIDPGQLIFVYNDQDYVRRNLGLWMQKLRLQP